MASIKKNTGVKVYDIVDKELVKPIQYGVYDLATNEGWDRRGIDQNAASFAVVAISCWWNEIGKQNFTFNKFYIRSDGERVNSSVSKL